ncbi:MFS transporter [Bradyrhizobium jicamae]|uniref:MFS transporter n=1 Tax=Bradyrhizobium jicamae TaxID=280332 RepID=A0ABS5FCZ8_9BRAD|nr:MFS transporter [Bradyrhizobium jicamae]MBR0794654.1 MFS transporter [Bradyrhizobium jicamae]MBR0934515.1 MFS transporter [Bradyrhizobium jicamae]
MTAKADQAARRTGVYLAVLQLVFTLGWTTYLIYLPKLCAEVGIAPATVILILMMDQGIFTITDTAMGLAADRISIVVGRLGIFVGCLAAISCAAFIALPYVAGTGPGARVWLIALIVVWAVTSSALRAPPLTLLGKYRAQPSIPFLAALAMLGYGLAGALSPYLGVMLRDQDARLPFVLSGAVLLLTALAFSGIERRMAREVQPAQTARPAAPIGAASMFLIVVMVILSLGYQLHFSINSGPFFLRFAKPDDLQWLMPVFWIGFSIAMFPASAVVKHQGGVIVMGLAGLLGALAIVVAEVAGSLNILIAAQFMAGAAWGCMLMSAVSAALAIGQTGAEGRITGLVFSALALATCARMAAVAGGLQKLPDYAPLLRWAPVACWFVAGAGLLVIAASRQQRSAQIS